MMNLLSYYSIKLPIYLTYMAQQVEYEPDKFIDWLKRKPNLQIVMHRQKIVMTKKAISLIAFQYLAMLAYLVLIGALSAYSGLILCLVLLVPMVGSISLILAIYGGRIVSLPSNTAQINRSRKIFSTHKGLKIAILGSYGKTTLKELLSVVLGEAKNVKATPGNKNVAISHARWAAKLSGDEEVLLIEFGESRPGDIGKFYDNTKTDKAVITGIAPNHLDKYKTVKAVADDLFSIGNHLDAGDLYVHTDNQTERYNPKSLKAKQFTKEGTDSVKINKSDVELSIEGMKFKATVGDKGKIQFETGLIGRHLLGPLAVCIDIADKLGLSIEQITAGVGKTRPFEHRLQPREINGAWIIDDTYNGSLEGFRAGLKLLKELKAKRKIYVTPGLVDQGEETEDVHKEIGKLIAECNPKKVVLINNSVTGYIEGSLKQHGYKGEIELRDDPLEFYTNLEHTLASGDIAMLQNDWTDNYY